MDVCKKDGGSWDHPGGIAVPCRVDWQHSKTNREKWEATGRRGVLIHARGGVTSAARQSSEIQTHESDAMKRITGVLLVATVPFCAGASPPPFTDVTEEAGIDFRHVNGANGSKFVLETVGPGAAFVDVDGDGDLDIYLINGAEVPGTTLAEKPRNALYLNQQGGRFTDATAEAHGGDTGYGMGCSAADIDNDGDLDLYITNVGANVLYRNDGEWPNVRFTNIAKAAGVDDGLFGSGSAFADVDGDGLVDLFVANYHNFSFENHRVCTEGGSDLQLYCGPEAFEGVGDVLYRNRGDGTFEDITERAGLLNTQGKELGVIFGDLDLDGDADLYLANDRTMNFLYLNDGGGHFEEVGLLAGAAFNEDGEVEAGMGVDMGDLDNDTWPDLFVTNFQWETNTFYHNLGDGSFRDETFVSGLGMGSIPYLSWGTRFVDFDNDGDRDVFIANGHLESDVEHIQSTTFAQRNQLFVNDGSGRFVEHTNVAGTALAVEKVSRGAAFGDYDDDGDWDILVANCADTPTLMRNDQSAGNNWLRVRLQGRGNSNRAAIGARVEVASGDLVLVDEVRSGGSYLSQSDLRLFFGLGARDRVETLKVRWPSGQVEVLENLPVNGDIALTEKEP